MKYIQHIRSLEDPALNHQRKENMKLKLSFLENLTVRHDTNSDIFLHILKIVLMHHVCLYDKILLYIEITEKLFQMLIN